MHYSLKVIELFLIHLTIFVFNENLYNYPVCYLYKLIGEGTYKKLRWVTNI